MREREASRAPAVYQRRLLVGGLAGLLLLGCGYAAGQGEGGSDLSAAGLGRIEKTLEGERELRGRVDAFFKAIEAGDTAGAYGELLKGSPLGGNRESIDKLVEDTSKVLETYGAMRSHELVAVHRVGSRMIRFTFLSYSDDYPLKWQIYSFRGQSGWQTLDISVNNDFSELFDGPGARRRRPAAPATGAEGSGS